MLAVMLFSGYVWLSSSAQHLSDRYFGISEVDTTVMTYAGLFGASYDTVVNGQLCIPEITVGDIILKDVWVSTATHNRASGSSILEHVSLIIDAPRESETLYVPQSKGGSERDRVVIIETQNSASVNHPRHPATDGVILAKVLEIKVTTDIELNAP